jgi:Raf kinase inhibitor-like YbhB/YbcL family protein
MSASMMLRWIAVALLLTGCAALNEEASMPGGLTVTSSAFAEGEAIPARYGCDGEGLSPPLAWSGAPEGTAAFAIVMDDPDARGFVHWTVADLPSETTSLEQGERAGTEGRSSFGRAEYGGPCPPSGTHRYVFEVFALPDALGLAPGFSADELRAALEGRVLASGRLTGTYTRGR